MQTYTPKASEIQRDWYVVDAEGLVLGHIDTGDHVIVVNAAKVVLSGNSKAEDKRVYRHSGYPGGLKSRSYADLMDRKPAEAVRGTIRGMLPKGPLGRKQLTKLKVYAGPDHPHGAQAPKPLEIKR